jgi:uncharacterized membrane protein HdeD (DUF308 family)
MNETINAVMTGAIAMAALVAALFFLRFWRQTRDNFFFLFAVAFAIEGLSRFALAFAQRSDETEPFFYIPRLVTFVLIIVAIVLKNRPRKQN